LLSIDEDIRGLFLLVKEYVVSKIRGWRWSRQWTYLPWVMLALITMTGADDTASKRN
jgi:hypothetical protein